MGRRIRSRTFLLSNHEHHRTPHLALCHQEDGPVAPPCRRTRSTASSRPRGWRRPRADFSRSRSYRDEPGSARTDPRDRLELGARSPMVRICWCSRPGTTTPRNASTACSTTRTRCAARATRAGRTTANCCSPPIPQRPAEVNFQHAARQAYIAFGAAVIAAAEEQVDATPMEGFDPDKLDEIHDCARAACAVR